MNMFDYATPAQNRTFGAGVALSIVAVVKVVALLHDGARGIGPALISIVGVLVVTGTMALHEHLGHQAARLAAEDAYRAPVVDITTARSAGQPRARAAGR